MSDEETVKLLKKHLGFPGHESYEHTLCPSYKIINRRGAASDQREFDRICEYGIEGLCLCYCLAGEDLAGRTMSEEEMRSLCRRCDHYIGKGSDPWAYNSIYNPKIVLEKYKHYIERKNPSAFVYLVSDGKFVKIGKAQDPAKRLAGIQTGNPSECKILYLIPVRSASMAYQVEEYLHSKYQSYQMCGEWFDILEKLEHDAWSREFPPTY